MAPENQVEEDKGVYGSWERFGREGIDYEESLEMKQGVNERLQEGTVLDFRRAKERK